jgi:hypothetical protein
MFSCTTSHSFPPTVSRGPVRPLLPHLREETVPLGIRLFFVFHHGFEGPEFLCELHVHVLNQVA